MSQRSLTFIIPTLHRPDYLVKCLATICRQTVLPEEVIVIDQSDDDRTRRLIESTDLGPIQKVYFRQPEKSLILARNNGIRLAKAQEFISFLDDDVELAPDYVERLVQHFDSNPRYAGGMGTIVGMTSKPRWFLSLFLMPQAGDGRFLINGVPTFPHSLPRFTEVEFLSGGMSMYRAAILREYRFDDRLGATPYGYGDDVDVSYRVSRKHPLFMDPMARLTDVANAPGRDPGILHRRRWIQNMFYLLKKNVGANPITLAAFFWMVLGHMLDDLRHLRKGAFIGNFLAVKNILIGRLDSIKEVSQRT